MQFFFLSEVFLYSSEMTIALFCVFLILTLNDTCGFKNAVGGGTAAVHFWHEVCIAKLGEVCGRRAPATYNKASNSA